MEQFQTISVILLISWFFMQVSAEVERSTYIIHMDKSFMPKAFSTHNRWYSSLLHSSTSMPRNGIVSEPKLIHTYDNAFHGFSAVMSETEIAALRKSPGFLSAYADDVVTPDTTHSYKFLSLNTAAGLWPASEYGKDVIIGVVDSGIWPESPSFDDAGMTAVPARWKGICQAGDQFNSSLCNKKLIGARYFNQGSRAANPDVAITVNSARDESGHGTHVASTAAGNYVDGVSFFGYATGRARGVAPRARIAAYKVIGWDGGSFESDALAGIDQAVADGVDILSISLSYRRTNIYENPIAIAGFGARAKGILVSVSAGNQGPSAATVLDGIPWAVIVASGTVDRWFAGKLTLGNGKSILGWTMFPARAIIKDLPLIYNETLSACSSTELLAEAPEQSIIICNITDDSVSFSSLMGDLIRSNLGTAIIISEDTRILRSTSFPFPGVVITPSEAQGVITYASSTKDPKASVGFQETVLGKEPRAAPALSGSSARGPGRSYRKILKPDIMAPGVLILAAYNPQNSVATIGNILVGSDYNLVSGTSMACPHISGIAALLKAANPKWSPAAIQSAMMTTANPHDNTKQPIKDMGFDYRAATPLGMGSGQVDPNRALDPGLVYDATVQDYVNLVCSMNFTQEQTRTIIRSSYNCSNPSSDLNYPSFIALYEVGENLTTVARFKRTATNVGEGAATYKVKVDQPKKNSTVRISPEVLVFGKKYDRQSYSVTIRYTSSNEYDTTEGALTWVEVNGKHTVRSPIVIYPIINSDEYVLAMV